MNSSLAEIEPRKYSDQLIGWLADLGYTHCFFVAGGNIMHLLDSARSRLTCIPCVHEVAAGIAVEYFNQVSRNNKAFALVTAGPGLTNIVTAIAGAWLEHRELLVIGGQVKAVDLMSESIRQRGIQEIDGVSIVKSICKRAITLSDQISETDFKASVELGFTGRNGPIFLEVCLDVQGSPPRVESIQSTSIRKSGLKEALNSSYVDLIKKFMGESQRPVWLFGAGVSRSTAKQLSRELEQVKIPLLTSWHGADRISSHWENYFGRVDTWGQRAANLIVNQADLVVVFGARLGLQETGFNWQEFAAKAIIIHIEIDQFELSKGHPRVDFPIHHDANLLLEALVSEQIGEFPSWFDYCKEVKQLLPLNESSNLTRPGYVSPYSFYLDASNFSDADDVWIPASSGGANSVAIQALRQWGNQIIVCNNGLASMGYGLSGAVGAAFASSDRRVWLIEGDGGFSQNVQELSTVAVNSLNIKIFIFANNGYGSIRTTQRNYFDGAYLGCDTQTGLGFPNWHQLAQAYEIPVAAFPVAGFSDPQFGVLLDSPGPLMVVVPIDPEQTYWPKITSHVTNNGSMESNPLYRMSPDLPDSIQLKVGKYL